MASVEMNLVAVEVRKWDVETQKVTLLSYFVIENQEKDLSFDVNIMQPPEMVEEYLGKLRYEAGNKCREVRGQEDLEMAFENETFLRQKTYNYFKRITSELNNPRRKKGQPKMIFTKHMDIYNETQDISFLPLKFQFFVVLNWARKYYEQEDYKKAVDPLRRLIKIDPGYGPGYKWLARSLKKIRKYDEAMKLYEKYAEVEGTIEARLDLAKSYRKGKLFEQSEKIYHDILAEDAKNQEARIGLAQIYYANKDSRYLGILDQLHQEAPAWLKEWLTEEFNFRIYLNDKTLLTSIQATKLLGYSKTTDLSERAFKNEIPSHFNSSKARLSFYREELENWAEVMNRFNCLKEEVKLYPERLAEAGSEAEPVDIAATDQTEALGKTAGGGKPRTKVEEILMHIRARKAQRQAEQNGSASEPAAGTDAGMAGAKKNKPKREAASDSGRQRPGTSEKDNEKKSRKTNGVQLDLLDDDADSVEKPKKRGPGRPRKTTTDADDTAEKPKRRRGRPPKSANAENGNGSKEKKTKSRKVKSKDA
ncbi:MAG: tetratricopeptide repeat protein [Calditrichaeota bacterium]|nr:tetratricopeptide repeat protein [Calditrichota bacterium]